MRVRIEPLVMINSAPYLIIFVLLGAVFLDYHLKYRAKDRRTKDHKAARRVLLGILVGGILAQQGLSISKDHRKKLEDLVQQKAFASNIAELKSEFASKSAVINSNQLDLMRKNRELVTALVTNSSVDANTRSKILAADQQFETVNADVVDLNAWREDWSRRQSMNALQARETTSKGEKGLWDACVPVHDYTIRRLEWLLGEIGRQKNETLNSNFKGIPSTLMSGPIAELRLGTNGFWHFMISVGGMPHPHLHVTPKLGTVSINVAVNPSEIVIGGAHGAYSDHRKIINTALKDFLAEVAFKEPTNK